MNSSRSYRRHGLLAFLAYLVFVVYGSLVPFEYREHTLEQALRKFAAIPWLDLKATSRADWVANLVLYVPLAFLACAVFAGARSALLRHARSLLVLAMCLSVAIGVEFVQIFFAPRTVSLNDLLAETLGTLAGIAVWAFGHDALRRLWQDFLAGGRRSLTAAIAAFLIAYIGLGLFPYDFVVSSAEFDQRLASGVGLVLADWGQNPLRILARLFGEAVAIAPLGLLIGLLASRISLRRTFAAGAAVGLLLELAQLLLVSGITQGASIAMRGLGLAGGTWLGAEAQRHGLLPVARWVRRLALPAMLLYLPLLFALNGWLHPDLAPLSQLGSRLAQVQWLPFWYHYYTTEPVALASLLANFAFYAPLGVLAWARQLTVPRLRRRGAVEPALWAVSLATAVEGSKLLLVSRHPDPTNLLIGAAGAAFVYLLAQWLTRVSDEAPQAAETTDTLAAAPVAQRRRGVTFPLPQPLPAIAAAGSAALALWGLWLYPLPLFGMAVLAYLALLWFRPRAWLWVLPLALPVMDFAQLGGRQLLDAFDLLVLATLALGYWRLLSTAPLPWPNRRLQAGSWLLAASCILSLGIGLWPAVDQGDLGLASSHPPLEAWMVGKGLVWALLLLPLLRRVPAGGLQRLVDGLAGGLLALSLAVLWERHVHVGIGDLGDVFRVTGPFSAMANGGAYIEAFIALAFPALAMWTLRQRRLAWRLAGIGAAALAAYAMLVTYSRGGYAGLLAALLIVGYFAWRARAGVSRMILAGLVVAAIAAALPVLMGDFAQHRLSLVGKDLQTRLDHWQRALEIRSDGAAALLAGDGFGRYPALYLWRAGAEPAPGTFKVLREDGRNLLRLGSGDAYYLDQIIHPLPGRPYLVSARLRFQGGVDSARIPVCEKALLYSFHCNWHELRRPQGTPDGTWVELSQPLNLHGFGNTGRWPARPIKLSLATPRGEGAIDIARLRVHAGQDELLRNGEFHEGLRFWLAVTDRDLAWHIHQTQIEVLFAQGLLGLLAFTVLLGGSLARLLPAMRHGDPIAIALGAGIGGFIVVGLLGSTLDAARGLFGFCLVLLASAAPAGETSPVSRR